MGTTVDLATLLGVGGAFAMVAGAMLLGGQVASFLDAPSVLIVIGGTFLVTTISFSLGEIAAAQGLMLRAAVYNTEAPEHAVWQALYLRSEEHTSELQSLMRISYAVFCLKKKKRQNHPHMHQ